MATSIFGDAITIRSRRISSRIMGKAIHILHKLQGKQIVHFLHIRKTGGTAVKYALKNNLVSSKYIIYLHGHAIKLKNIRKGDKVVFFLRDPVNRFVSGFYSRMRQGQPTFFFPWGKEEKVAFSRFNTPNQLALALSSDDKKERAKGQHAMESISHLKKSYWNWFESEAYLLSRQSDIFFIGFQENLSQDFEILKSKLRLSNNLKLPSDDIQSHRCPRNLDKTLENEAIRNIRDWYKDDYKLISLCKSIIEQEGCGGSPEIAEIKTHNS